MDKSRQIIINWVKLDQEEDERKSKRVQDLLVKVLVKESNKSKVMDNHKEV